MQFFETRQLKWIAGFILLILATREMRDRNLPEMVAQAQPVGMPLVWLRRITSVVLAFGALIILVLIYQNMSVEILRFISGLPMEVK